MIRLVVLISEEGSHMFSCLLQEVEMWICCSRVSLIVT